MKKINQLHLLLAVIMPLLYSCNAVHNLQLNTIRPAQVEYHSPSPNIVVVNNAEEPDSRQYSRYIDENNKRYRLSFDTDSVAYMMTMSLATHLYDSHIFNRVDVVFSDSSNITGSAGIDGERLSNWRLESPQDVFVVINNIKPVATMQVVPLDGMFGAELSVVSLAYLQCLVPGKEEINLVVNDTIAWHAYGETPDIARMYLPAFEECIDEAIISLSQVAADRFTPHRCIVDRYIFVTGHPAMKDAYRYWEEEKFEEASYIWEYVYKKGKDQGRRAKAAANLAIYNEIEENFAQALEYIEEAMKIFVEKNYVAEAEYASSYYQDLKKRIEENNILNNMKW